MPGGCPSIWRYVEFEVGHDVAAKLCERATGKMQDLTPVYLIISYFHPIRLPFVPNSIACHSFHQLLAHPQGP